MSARGVPIRQRAEYLVYRFAVRRVAHLSEKGLEKWTARVSRILRRLIRRRDRLAATNLARVFPERSREERETILAACWEHFTGMAFRTLRAADAAIGPRKIILDGEERFRRAIALDKGVIVVTAHYGEWEGAAAAVALAGVPAIAVARRLDNPLLHEEVHAARSSHGIVMVDRRRAAKRMLSALEDKKMVILLVDQAAKPREGVLLPFLGRPAWTATSPAKLALRTGAPILPLYCLPEADGIRIRFEEPIDIAELDPSARTVESILLHLNRSLEKQILERPELWLWMHDRWKGTSQPPRPRA